MIKGIIFDLDQTLVDSSIAEALRKERKWQMVYELIPRFIIYDGIYDVFDFINKTGIRSCIVTTSPKTYAEKVVTQFSIPCEFIIDYFATKEKKPSPQPMKEAIRLFGLESSEVISFGDRVIDIQSSNSAGIKSVACLWGTVENKDLLEANPTFTLNSPREILFLLNSKAKPAQNLSC